jgi:hypothetical protein
MIKKGAMIGTAVGVGIAVVLLTLPFVNPFYTANGAIERLTFRLCPLYFLVFANGMGSMANVVIITIIGNAILYGIAFGVIAAMLSLYRRFRSHAE